MKTFKILSFVAGILALTALASCAEKVEDPFIKIDGEKEFNLTKEQRAVTVKVLSNRDWGVRVSEKASDWIVVEPKTGKASDKPTEVTITVLANSGANRSTAIEFYTGTASEMVTINQEGPDGDSDGVESLTVAEFISRADESTLYRLAGTVSGFNASYCSFDLTDATDKIYVYSVSETSKALWKDKIKNGGTVILQGKYKLFNGKHEVVDAIIDDFSGGIDVVPGTPEGNGTLDSPYNVAAAIQAVKNLTWTDKNTFEKVGPYYVKGKISAIEQNYVASGTFGTARFSISDDGKDIGSEQFTVYNLKYLNNVKYTSGTDIKLGDDVIIYAELINYQNNTPENSGGYLYALNDEKPVEVEYEDVTIAQIIEKGAGAYNVVNATVVCAPSKNTMIVDDGTAMIYSYKKSHGFAEGDVLTLKGKAVLYEGHVLELEDPEATKTGTATVTRPNAVMMDGAAVDAYFSADVLTVKYVTIAGVIAAMDSNGKTYYNLKPTGASVCETVSLYYGERDMSGYDGKAVKVTGYVFTRTEDTKNISQALVEIVEDGGAEYFVVNPNKLTWAADETSAKTVTVSTSLEGDITVAPDEAAFGGDVWATASVSGTTVTITPNSANESETDARAGAFTVSCGDLSAIITVSQAKKAGEYPFTSNVTWTLGEKAYDQNSTGTNSAQTATINGIAVNQMVKLGTSSVSGNFTVNLPSGATKLAFFALGWKNNNPKLTITNGSDTVRVIDVKPNNDVAGDVPYNITTEIEDAYYEIDVPNGASTLKFAADKRVVLWGINAY